MRIIRCFLLRGGFAQILPKPDAEMLDAGLRSYTKRAFIRNMLLVLMFACYLFASGVFMGSYISMFSGAWFTDDVSHLVIGFVLYAVCSIGVSVEYRKERSSLLRSASGASSFFWGSFMLLLTIFLYCVALLNPVHVGLCAEIVLPSRPLAMVLLWLLGFAWARRADRKIAQYIMVAIPLIIIGMNVVADVFWQQRFYGKCRERRRVSYGVSYGALLLLVDDLGYWRNLSATWRRRGKRRA